MPIQAQEHGLVRESKKGNILAKVKGIVLTELVSLLYANFERLCSVPQKKTTT